MKFRSLILFGPPGCGKGTIGKILAEAGGHYHLSSGDIFRGLSEDSPEGKLFQSYVSKGLLCPDDVTMEIWRSHVDQLIATNRFSPSSQWLILDGIPRTKQQAQLITQQIEVLATIVFEVPKEVLIERLTKRAALEGRSDDTDLEVVKKRLWVYEEETHPILEALDPKTQHLVNGNQDRLSVLRDTLSCILPLSVQR